MPNNFKLQGNYYVSKFGNDSWDGLTPDTPKRTLQATLTAAGSNKTIIIGSGVYKETVSYTGNNLTLYGDGLVIIDGDLITTFTLRYNTDSVTFTLNNLYFRNDLSSCVNILASLTIRGVSTTFNDCVFMGRGSVNIGYNSYGATGLYFNRCKFINSKIEIGTLTTLGTYLNSCILINSILLKSPNGTSILNTYVDRSSLIIMAGVISFNYSNIQAPVAVDIATSVTSGVYQDFYGRYYNLAIAGNNTTTDAGTISNPYYRADVISKAFIYSTFKILYPAYNVNGISADPLFNDILSQDFTLQSGSPHIGRASDGINNIGGTPYAVRLAANSSSFSGSGATVDSGLTFSYDNYVISGSAVTGSVTSAPIFISSSAKVIQDIEYNGLLAFNKTISSFFYSGSNVNVPDFDTYTSASGNPGANPDRLVYYMRLTTGSTQPAVDADWDNGDLWTRGDYNVFEWNTKPSIDVYGRGNGDPNFVVANYSYLKATYIQMKVKLRNDYLL